MDFLDFARSHGILINSLPPIGVWRRYKTASKPHKRNGAVLYRGNVGWVQDHATMPEPAIWVGQEPNEDDLRRQKELLRLERMRIAEVRRKAAEKARRIVSEAEVLPHPYLAKKIAPEASGLVWQGRLVIPMRADGELVGCQLIDETGDKRFLYGQRTVGATYTMGRGTAVWVEGYATGLSALHAASVARLQIEVRVCFSAHNLKTLANRGVVLADHDKAGLEAAQATGLKYWSSDTPGEDFNDFHKRAGDFQASMAIKRLVLGQ